jgi:hypothetical protein
MIQINIFGVRISIGLSVMNAYALRVVWKGWLRARSNREVLTRRYWDTVL